MAWLGVPIQMPAIGPHEGYRESQPLMNGGFIFLANDRGHPEATAKSRWSLVFNCPAGVKKHRETWERCQ